MIVRRSFLSTPFATAFFITNKVFDRLSYLSLLSFNFFYYLIMSDLPSKKILDEKHWSPGQLIYDYDTPSFHAFLIVKGSVNIYSRKGLKLNTLYEKEMFGESSLLLDKKRSVAAKAGENGASAHLIPKAHITSLQEEAPLLAAILRKVQLRLEDSNNQSVELAKQIEVILNLVKTQKETNKAVEQKLEQMKLNIQDSFRSD